MKLTACEKCGMLWTALPREACPRCAVAEGVQRLREALHELDMIVNGHVR